MTRADRLAEAEASLRRSQRSKKSFRGKQVGHSRSCDCIQCTHNKITIRDLRAIETARVIALHGGCECAGSTRFPCLRCRILAALEEEVSDE